MSDRLPRRIGESLPALPMQQHGTVMLDGGRQAAVLAAMEDLKAIRTFVHDEMKDGLDFGIIPGTPKKSLWLPGAQKIAMFYNTSPEHHYERTELGEGHLECVVTTRLVNRASSTIVSSGLGSCSTMEKKYRWRGNSLICPKCGKDAIRKSKDKPEFYCWRKIEGCGATFKANDPEITKQGNGSPVENPDIYDLRNTVLKMAKKRAQVDAAMSLGCVSEIFTQDIEDIYDLAQYEASVVEMAVEPVKPQNNSGHATGMYASPEQIEAYRRATLDFCTEANARWADEWTNAGGPVEGISDVLHPTQMTRHLLKWAIATGRLAPVGMTLDPDTGKPVEKVSVEQAKAFVAVAYTRDPEAIRMEAENYFRRQCDLAREAWRKKHGRDENDVYSTEGGMEN